MLEKLTKQLEINAAHIDDNIATFSRSLLSNPKSIEHSMQVVSQSRPDITPLHFGLLVYSAYRYAYLKSEDFSSELIPSWDKLLMNSEVSFTKTLDHALAHKSVNITTPARYGAINLAISTLFGDQNLNMCDVGCGFFPSGIGTIKNPIYPEGENDWNKSIINRLTSKAINIGQITAVDLNELDVDWTASCAWTSLPELVNTRCDLQNKLLSSNKDINFYVADITKDDAVRLLQPNSQNLISMANVMYQITPSMRENMFINISTILKEGGWFLSMEYLDGGSRRRPFTYGMIGYQKKAGNLLGEGKLLMTLDSADCNKIRINQ